MHGPTERDRRWEEAQRRAERTFNGHEPDDAGSGSWPDPDMSIMDDRRGALPEFPLDTVPALADWLTRASAGAGATPGHVAVPLLSIASSLIGAARRVKASSSWSEPMTLWSGVVGYSGTAKTPGLNVTTKVLAYIERERRSQIADMRRAHEARVEAAKAAQKKWKAEVQDAVDAGRRAPDMPVEATDPGPFVEPRLFVSDSTVERLAVLLQGRPRGLSLVGDELAGLFMNMGRYSGGSDREFWLTAWNGGSFVVERQGRPPVVLDHLLVGITGGLQPDKLVKCFEGDQDGMYARLLIGWPEEAPYQPLSDDADELEPEFLNAMFRLVNLPAEDDDGNFVPKSIRLSREALREFEQFRQFLHVFKNGFDGREREWMAKGPGQVLRLSGTLAFLGWAMRGGLEPDEIEAEFISSAVRLWREYFLPHSRAALRLIGLSDRHVDARKALRWVRAHSKREVSREDIRRDALSQRLDADATQVLIDSLVETGWLREITTKQSGPGRRSRRWAVNPSLFQ